MTIRSQPCSVEIYVSRCFELHDTNQYVGDRHLESLSYLVDGHHTRLCHDAKQRISGARAGLLGFGRRPQCQGQLFNQVVRIEDRVGAVPEE